MVPVAANTSSWPVEVGRYERNAEWALHSARLLKEYVPVDNTSLVPLVHLAVSLARRPCYFLINVIFPSVLITLLSVFVFLLPNESGEKVSLATTIFLSYTVLLLIVSDISPRNGDSVPLVSE